MPVHSKTSTSNIICIFTAEKSAAAKLASNSFGPRVFRRTAGGRLRPRGVVKRAYRHARPHHFFMKKRHAVHTADPMHFSKIVRHFSAVFSFVIPPFV
jgi:hypothetical protein